METIRLNGELYIILSGTIVNTHIQAISVHKFSPKESKIQMIHEVQLGNVPLKVWAYNAKSWVQNGTSIFYFEIDNQLGAEQIVYKLHKYDLVQQV